MQHRPVTTQAETHISVELPLPAGGDTTRGLERRKVLEPDTAGAGIH